MAPVRRVHLPSLAVELSVGWTVSERAVFRSPSGVDVHVRLDPAGEHATSHDLLHARLDDLRRDVGELFDLGTAEVEPRPGRSAHRAVFLFDREDGRRRAELVCWSESGCHATVVAVAAADDERASADVADVVRGLRIIHRPSDDLGLGRPDAPADSRPVRERVPVPAAEWATLRTSWGTPAAETPGVGAPALWSVDELAVLAMLLQVPAFPTVDVELVDALPEAAATAALGAVVRSFVARGIVAVDDGGSAVLADQVADDLELAVRPHLTISVERATGAWWIGASPRRALRVTVLPGGLRRCEQVDPADLVDLVCELAGAPAPTTDGADVVDAVDSDDDATLVLVDDLVEGRAPVAEVVQIRTAWVADGLVRGAEVTWAIAPDGSFMTGEPDVGDRAGWRFRPATAAALRAELLSVLPGG